MSGDGFIGCSDCHTKQRGKRAIFAINPAAFCFQPAAVFGDIRSIGTPSHFAAFSRF